MARKKPPPRNRVTKRPPIPRALPIDLPNKHEDTPSRRPRRTGALSERRASLGQRIVGGRVSGLNRLEIPKPFEDTNTGKRSRIAVVDKVNRRGVEHKARGMRAAGGTRPIKNRTKRKK